MKSMNLQLSKTGLRMSLRPFDRFLWFDESWSILVKITILANFAKRNRDQTCRRVYNPTSGRSGQSGRVGSGRVGSGWQNSTRRFSDCTRFFSSLTRLVTLTDGGSDSNPTKHIEIVKKFLNYSKFSNPTWLVRPTDVGSGFNTIFRLALGFTTQRRVGSGRVRKSWPEGFQTWSKCSFSDSIQMIRFKDVGFDCSLI